MSAQARKTRHIGLTMSAQASLRSQTSLRAAIARHSTYRLANKAYRGATNRAPTQVRTRSVENCRKGLSQAPFLLYPACRTARVAAKPDSSRHWTRLPSGSDSRSTKDRSFDTAKRYSVTTERA